MEKPLRGIDNYTCGHYTHCNTFCFGDRPARGGIHWLTLSLSVCLLNSLSYSGIWDGQWMNKEALKFLLFAHIVVIDSLPTATSPAIPTTDLLLGKCVSAFGRRSLVAHYETGRVTPLTS